MDVVASSCKRSPEVDAEVWAHLCAVNFPTMYESVLNDIERGCVQKAAGKATAAGSCTSKGSGSGAAGGTRGGARQSRVWRRQKPKGRQAAVDRNQGQEDSSAPASMEPSPDLRPGSSPLFSPAESPSMSPSFMLSISAAESPNMSPSMSPSFPVGSSPADSPSLAPSFLLDVSTDVSASASPMLPSMSPSMSPSALGACSSSSKTSIAGRNVEASLLMQADWRALYARRMRKKLEWETSKKSSGRERTASNATDDSSKPSPSLAKADSKRVSVSSLSVREIGRLSDAAYRLKVCSLCGEKFSPGESRGQQTSCCFHPGDFSPAEARGWSRKELKELRMWARQALRSAGGASWVQRHPRASRGHGHWMKGLGVLANDMKKVRQCLEGEVPVTWSCCGADELFATGCQRGMHRHFH